MAVLAENNTILEEVVMVHKELQKLLTTNQIYSLLLLIFGPQEKPPQPSTQPQQKQQPIGVMLQLTE